LAISIQIANIVFGRESDSPRLDVSVFLKGRAGRFREGSRRPASIRQLAAFEEDEDCEFGFYGYADFAGLAFAFEDRRGE